MIYYQAVVDHPELEVPFYCSQLEESYNDALCHAQEVAHNMGLSNVRDYDLSVNTVFVKHD